MWARPDLRAELKGLGLLRSPDLDQAFLHVRQESFLPESLSLLEAAGFGAVRVLPSIPDETFDRILVLDATPPKQLVRLLADPGSLIGRGRGVHDLAFVKLVRRSGETAQMTFNEAPSGGAEGPSE